MVAVLLKSCSQASIHLCTYDVCGANGGLPCCSNSRVCNLQAYGAMRSRRVSIWSRAMWRGQPESPPFSPRARRTLRLPIPLRLPMCPCGLQVTDGQERD